MRRYVVGLSAVGLLALLASPAGAQQEMVANPYYKFWANAKPGATAVRHERTKLSGPGGQAIPGGVDEKRITYKLVEVNDERAIVEMVVTEEDFLGYVQSPPTRYVYPAKWKKSHLDRIHLDSGDKPGEDTVKVDGKDLKCRTVSGTLKGSDGEQVEFKLWLCDDVPGSIVKHVRTTRQKDEVVAETTVNLQSYK